MRTLRILGVVLLGLTLAAMTGWGALAIHYSDITSTALRAVVAGAFGMAGVATLTALVSSRWRWRALAAFVVVFAALIAWWGSIAPANDRDWRSEEAVLPYATLDGDRVTVRNIRNFDYRSETDFTPAYYDRSFNWRELESVDLVTAYWMGPAIAHVFLSFGFADRDHLAISIEARKERGEGYSSLKGFFKQYELYYVVADERDVIRVRTNYRQNPPEDVYLYRLHGSTEHARRLFLEYLKKINSLKVRPEFYNTLTTNCTSNIWLHSRVNPGHPPFSWKILLSGYVPEYLYEAGRLDTGLSFPELRSRAHINAQARRAGGAEDFSRQIREGLPGVEP